MAPLPSLDTYIQRGKQYKTQQPTTEPDLDPADLERMLTEAEAAANAPAVNFTKPPKKDRRHPRRDEVTTWVKAAGDEGITVADVRGRLEALYPGEQPPSDTAIQKWFADHPNITKPGRGTYIWTDTPSQ